MNNYNRTEKIRNPSPKSFGKSHRHARLSKFNNLQCEKFPATKFNISKKDFDKNGLSIISRLNKAGFEAYFVGGCIRDLIIGITPKDFDIATFARPKNIKKIFGSRCKLIGKRFRLAHIYTNSSYIETSTFRAFRHSNNKNVSENVYGTIEDDARRRDFTINSLYYDPQDNVIYDFNRSVRDIKNRLIRFIANPHESVKEDPFRILRAIRFEAKIGFNLDAPFKGIIAQCKQLLASQNKDRMFAEIIKFFHSGHALKSVAKLYEYNLLEIWFPHTNNEIKEANSISQFLKTVLKNTDQRFRNNLTLNPSFILAALFWKSFSKGLNKKLENSTDFSKNVQVLFDYATNFIEKASENLKITYGVQRQIIQIWHLQYLFEVANTEEQYIYILTSKKFRAAYDFLLLRSMTLEPRFSDMVSWWTNIQHLQENKQLLAIKQKVAVI